MIFESPDDAKTLKNIGINVLLLVGVTLSLIFIAVLMG
jgi:hypothetical protein